jgi:hypothetical protein
VALASAMAGQTRSGARKRGGPGPRPWQGEAPLAPGAGAAGPPTRDVAGSTVVNSRLVKSGRTLASAIAMVRDSFLPVNLPFACTFYPCPMPIFDVVRTSF